MYILTHLHVSPSDVTCKELFVSLIEAVASGQLTEIFFFRYICLVGCVLQICIVLSVLVKYKGNLM